MSAQFFGNFQVKSVTILTKRLRRRLRVSPSYWRSKLVFNKSGPIGRAIHQNGQRGITLSSRGIACVLSGVTLSLACQHVRAQSSVTLYGMMEVTLRGLTNDNAQNQSRVFMSNGAIINSHIGLRGSEDLGGNLKAVFQIESNFNPQDGTLTDSGRLFNSMSYVGLSGDFGTVTFGRQDTPLYDKLISTYDPLTYANYPENSWLPYSLEAGLVADNSIRYTGQFGDWYVGAMYSFGSNYEMNGPYGFSGQVPGHFSEGNLAHLLVSYEHGPVHVGAGIQQLRDNSNNRQTVFNLNAMYAFSKVKLYAGWLHSQDNTGLVETLLAEQPIPAIGQLKNRNRIDDGPFGGFVWQVTPAVLLSTAVYCDHMRNAATVDGTFGSGNRYTVVELAEYELSKRTEIYGTVDYNRVSGAADVELPGRGNQTGFAIGMRSFF
ncbi:porin [Burkholderia multivorans]|uniref:porin n=1 Tax=Burkholderia multivorans TaxID=87883 RepID=UPI0012DD69ED|nr:porin [Burkholderia multivorans]MBU9152325.1 porin [Burkholderia multivorans]MCA8337462.1 porin [Burkholderia multivorans]MDN8011133.1 porin [Burkholderia multivorans]QGR87248.1 porin [Burkholderia multivorans]UXZ61601.1 porin [Burkholderia multivorans]